jgi:hypothetical protein
MIRLSCERHCGGGDISPPLFVWNEEVMMGKCCASYLESAMMPLLREEDKRKRGK